MLNVSLPSALLLQVGRFSGEETVSPAGEGIRNMPALHYKKMTGSYSEGGGTSRKNLMIPKSNTSTTRSTKLSRCGLAPSTHRALQQEPTSASRHRPQADGSRPASLARTLVSSQRPSSKPGSVRSVPRRPPPLRVHPPHHERLGCFHGVSRTRRYFYGLSRHTLYDPYKAKRTLRLS